MALKPQQLPAQLNRGLAPLYLIAGAEPLLVQECRDQVIQVGQAQGFTERNVYEVRRGFDWDLMNEDSSAMSLFASRKIVDIRMPTGKPGQDGAKALIAMVEEPDPDVLTIVSCDQWEASSRKSKWARRLGQSGVLVEIWPVKPQELPGWIAQRMNVAGLVAERDAVSLLAEMVEGNLLAAQQEIDKMKMRGGEATVTAADVAQAVGDSSRFDAFRLIECMLAGNLAEALRVATGLKRTGVAIQVVVGAMVRELTLAATFAQAVKAGESEATAFRRLRVWPARQGPMRAAAGRVTRENFNQAFSRLSLIDLQGKGRAPGDPWQTLDEMLCLLCQPANRQLAATRRGA